MSCEAKVATATIRSLPDENNQAITRTIIDCRSCLLHKVFDTKGNADTVFCEAAKTVKNHLPEECTPPKKYQ